MSVGSLLLLTVSRPALPFPSSMSKSPVVSSRLFFRLIRNSQYKQGTVRPGLQGPFVHVQLLNHSSVDAKICRHFVIRVQMLQPSEGFVLRPYRSSLPPPKCEGQNDGQGQSLLQGAGNDLCRMDHHSLTIREQSRIGIRTKENASQHRPYRVGGDVDQGRRCNRATPCRMAEKSKRCQMLKRLAVLHNHRLPSDKCGELTARPLP